MARNFGKVVIFISGVVINYEKTCFLHMRKKGANQN